jgi:superfamily II DNA or RNA helicase
MASSPTAGLQLRYDHGSLVLEGVTREAAGALPAFAAWDERIRAPRCLAIHYRALVRHLVKKGRSFADHARNYPDLPPPRHEGPAPYPFQREALQAWERSKRGVVELPTGSGKTRLALMAMRAVGRGTLVLVPTLELVTQWCGLLEREFPLEPGVVGGGSFRIEPVTVCTYASAYRHGEKFGDRFGLAVFDECHHLAGEGFSRIPELLLAPYRLGLSATLERADQRHHALTGLIGPVVYRKPITALSGKYLADYRVETLYASLSEAERGHYGRARETYLAFARARALPLASPRDWQQFVFAACRSPEGRDALAAYYRQRRIAFEAEEKFAICADLLDRHRGQRVLIFTNDNRTAFEVSTRFLLPLITHQTRVPERREILANFHSSRWPALVTSKVLNEGVDVPAAGVAVILSGNASVREHVQRLGRILRRDGEKEAVLYEVLTRDTMEEGTSKRRRRHDAYR